MAGVVLYIFSALATYLPAALVLTSYGLALVAIGRMCLAAGKEKALSTCASHFMVVVLFYAPVVFTYNRPALGSSMDQEWIIAIMYSVITPVLNPLIYTLRNKEVEGALRRVIRRKL